MQNILTNSKLRSIVEPAQLLGPENSQYSGSWTSQLISGDYSTALTLIDNELLDRPKSEELRLWWVHCQLELKQLPTTALAAPLEELHAELIANPNLHDVSFATFLKLGVALHEKNLPQLALTSFERSCEFARQASGVTPDSLLILEEYFAEALAEEIERARLKREDKKYIEELEEKLRAQRKKVVEASSKFPAQSSASPKDKKRFDSKAVAAAALEIDHGSSLATSDPSSGESQEVKEAEDAEFSQVDRNRKLIPISVAAVACGLFALSWSILFSATNEEGAIDSQLAMATQVSESNSFHTPLPNTLDPKASAPGTQDRILADVDKRLQSMQQIGEKQEDEKTTKGDGKLTTIDPKYGKNLSEPSDDDQVVSLSNIPRASNAIKQNKIPVVSKDRFATKRVEQVGSSPRKSRLGGQHATSSAPQLPPTQPKTIYGEPSEPKAYEVQKYDPPLLYRTITSTEVLTAPSLLANSLARLQSGTPIHVTRSMGHWLELRSTGGRIGFIYSQDAQRER